jgi:hypothetical protein
VILEGVVESLNAIVVMRDSRNDPQLLSSASGK